eukprot:SAG31_NODE_2433_length_5706_cov_2.207776_7_plen_92_part_00
MLVRGPQRLPVPSGVGELQYPCTLGTASATASAASFMARGKLTEPRGTPTPRLIASVPPAGARARGLDNLWLKFQILYLIWRPAHIERHSM